MEVDTQPTILRRVIPGWETDVYTILTTTQVFTEEICQRLNQLFETAECRTDISYRKLRLLAMLKSKAKDEDIVAYLYDSLRQYPYKPWICNHFFLEANPVIILPVFMQILSELKLRKFIWSDDVLTRVSQIIEASHASVSVIAEGSVEKIPQCSNCGLPIVKISNRLPCEDILQQFLIHSIHQKKQAMLTKHKSKAFLIAKLNQKIATTMETFTKWINVILQANLPYTVVVDGANIGRLVRHLTVDPNHIDIDAVTKQLIAAGEIPCIVLNEIHRSRYIGDQTHIIWSPKCISDDICWMSLALLKPHTTFITSDQSANWIAILTENVSQFKTYQLTDQFWIWMNTYKRSITVSKGQFYIEPIQPYSRMYQSCVAMGRIYHHLPLDELIHPGGWICWSTSR